MALNVVDIDASVRDAQDVIGLSLVDRTADRAILTSNTRRVELVLHRNKEDSARCVGLQALDAPAVDEATKRIKK
jgi:hypothetical protein